MSKGKEFPPRVWIDTGTLGQGDYPIAKTGSGRCIGDEQYLSKAEHEHLVSEARRETFNYVALQFERAANLAEDEKDARTNRLHAQWLRGKATEGASDE